jgi:DNA polymerase-3 subunit gamma/tau
MSKTQEAASYRVLARKYRPETFDQLIGQEAMVHTLGNAFAMGRLAHAFILTGVRGVGKTTTARIIARALNCIGKDGQGKPTPNPCGVCEHCTQIAEDRHVDVIEMDAASRTGVDDIRELIDGVRYRPVTARCKVYIIDEVHMLSRQAFNALLKTLEEPPGHVKFIFATTEVRKIPVTVLSRCQRFDLRRIDTETLARHLAKVAASEKADIAPGALALIAAGAEGSVRDALSLLDQAISHAQGRIEELTVREMIGLADRSAMFNLLDDLMKGEVAAALDRLTEQYRSGADPVVVLRDLLEVVHWLTRIKIAPEVAATTEAPEEERKRGSEMAERLSIPVLARAWQMLLAGLKETQTAPRPLQAAEMALVRLAFCAELPTPGEVVRRLAGTQRPATTPAAPAAPTPAPTPAPAPAPAAAGQQRCEAAEHPLVRAALETFPGARIEGVRELPDSPTQGDGVSAPPDNTASTTNSAIERE